jgi:hypothetical protein
MTDDPIALLERELVDAARRRATGRPLGLAFERVVQPAPRAVTPPRRRLIPIAVVLAVLVFAAVALAAGGLFSTGPGVTPGPGDLTSPHRGGGVILPRSVQGIAAQANDPAGAPPWGMRVLKTTRGLGCIQIGRVVADRLGVLGQDGAFANDGRFHPLPPQVVENPVDCASPDAHGHLYLSFESQGVPASGYNLGCTSPGDVEPHPNPPICSQHDERAVFAGLLGRFALSVTYATPGGENKTIATGPGGAYLIVLPADPKLDQGGANLPGLLPSPGNAQPIRRITYQHGVVCDITTTKETDADGQPCAPVGYVPPVLRTPARRLVAAPVTFTRRINTPEAAHGVHADDLSVTFIARVAVKGAGSAYLINLQLPKSRPCQGSTSGTSSNGNVAAGQRLRIHLTWASYANSPLRCPGSYSGTVSYVQTSHSSISNPVGIPGTPGTSRVLVGRFSFTVK